MNNLLGMWQALLVRPNFPSMPTTGTMNSTSSLGTAPSLPADEAAALNGAMDLLLLTTMCTGILIPISIALFLTFSRIWRTPVFILNVLALALGFANGGLTINYVVSSPNRSLRLKQHKFNLVSTENGLFREDSRIPPRPGVHVHVVPHTDLRPMCPDYPGHRRISSLEAEMDPDPTHLWHLCRALHRPSHKHGPFPE